MISQIKPYLFYYPYIMGGLMGLSVLLLLIALYNLRRQRTASIWRQRHDAGRRGGRLLLVSVSLLIFSTVGSAVSAAVIFAFGWQAEFFPPKNRFNVVGVAVSAVETEAIVISLTPPTPTPTASHTPDPNATPTITPTPTHTRPPTTTATPTQTTTPTDTVTPSVTPSPPPTLTPLPVGTVQVIAVDDTLTENDTPLDPRLEFDEGVSKLYFFVSYQGMFDGGRWSRVLYHNGEPVQGGVALWELGETGVHFFMFEDEEGFSPGTYVLRLSYEDVPLTSVRFEIAPDSEP